jgi:hypothetical protein
LGKVQGGKEESVMTNTINREGLADISKVRVDKSLPRRERIIEYVRQMNNDPYHYICNDFAITAKFSKDGPGFEDCLGRLMT